MNRHGEAAIAAREAEQDELYSTQRIFLDELFHTDTAKQREISTEEQRRKAQLVLAARAILSTENGKRFLFWLIDHTGVFAPCFTGNSHTFYLEGKRSIGLEVYRLLMEANPDAFQEIINFQRTEETHGK